jgi:phospho-N-acetylmuramoyl-pentapeptide-transferase
MIPSDVLKTIIPAVISFCVGIAITPIVSHYLYKWKLWKRSDRGNPKENPDIAFDFSRIHNKEAELSTPRVGGIIIWGSVLLTIVIIWILPFIIQTSFTEKLNFLSRNQTLLPFFTLIAASLIGLADDLLQIFGKGVLFVNGLSRLRKVGIVTIIAIIGAWWFYTKLGTSVINIPLGGTLDLGILFIPFFVLVVLGTFSSGIIDGLDGLAGGVFSTIFGAYGFIAFFQNQIDIATFCFVITGGILAFLWFNIPPARFYMGETGVLGLTVTLAVIGFLTNQILLLPIIGLPLVATSLSALIQMIAKKIHPSKKVFQVAPLHHHFQALGWPAYKITMRYWVLSIIVAIIGVIMALF